MSSEGCRNIFGLFVIIFYRNRTRFSRERNVLSSITICSLATIWTTAMYISFFHFEVRVASGDSRVAIFARIRIDNLPVHLGFNGTCNGSRVSLQLLKNYRCQWTRRVGKLALRNLQISECQNIFRFTH